MPRIHITSLLKQLLIAGPLFFSIPSTVSAQGDITIKPVTTFTTPGQAFEKLIPIVLILGAIACFGYIIYGAYKYITAGDNPANAAAGRQTIINACIGLVLLALSYIIWLIVLKAVGLDTLL